MEKRCFKCGEVKEYCDPNVFGKAGGRCEFYHHKKMADGHFNKCKACACADVAANSEKTREKRSKYEQARSQEPERKANVLTYLASGRRRNPEKSAARMAVNYALKTGNLVKTPCEVCGNPKSQAHHPDYSKPLDVRWLCFRHHREEHGQTVM